MDSTSDSSQREGRYQMHQTKQKSKAEAMKQAKLDQKVIEQRKASGQLPKLIKKDRRSTNSNSYVWQVFKEVKINGVAYVKCQLCLPTLYTIKYIGSSTSNMGHHIRTKHFREYQEIKNTGLQKNNNKIHSYVSRPAEWKPDGKKSVEWQQKILKFVVGTNQSLSVIDNPYFHALLPAEFVAPSRKYFTNVCLTTTF